MVLSLAMASCAAPLSIFDPAADPAQLRAEAHLLRAKPATRAAGQRQLAWLCLLHAQDCGDLVQNGAAGMEPALPGHERVLAALLQALALQPDADIGRRAQAWWTTLDAAQLEQTAQADALATAAAEALAHLAVRDRRAVLATVAPHAQSAILTLQQGAPMQRWRRTAALGPLLATSGVRLADSAEPAAPTLRVQVDTQPLSRRLFTGLAALPAAPTADDRLAAQRIDLPLERTQQTLPAGLRGGRYLVPARDPGIYALRATFSSPTAARWFLVVQAPRPLRVWVGGRAWPHPHQPAAREVTGWIDAVAGQNQLDLALAVAGNGQALQLGLLAPQGAAQPQPQPPWPQAAQLAVAALLDADGPAGASLASLWPHAPLPAMVALDTAASLDSQKTAAAGVLDHVLDALGEHVDAQVDRAGKVRDAGNPALALQMLGTLGLPPMSPVTQGESRTLRPSPAAQRADIAFERATTMLALGLPDEAARLARAAVLAQTGDCAVFERALTLGLDSLNRALLRQLLLDAPSCPHEALLLAQAQALIGAQGAAQASWRAALQEPALALEATRRLQALQDADPTSEPLPPFPWARDRAASRWREAQRAEVRRDARAAQRALADLLTGTGIALEVRQQALQAGAAPPWQPFVRSGEALAAMPDDAELVQGAGSVYLLDQEIVVLLPGGGALRRVHQIVRILNDAAAEALGEVRVAEGADLEFARTLLPDGTIVLPAETADKETISLRAVSAGCAVEYAQTVYVAPEDPATGATRLGSFLLQATDGPVALAEVIVLVPKSVQADLTPSPLLAAPAVSSQGEFTVHTYRRSGLPRFRPEPRAVRAELAMPSLRITAQATLAGVIEPWNETLASFLELHDAELERWLAVGRALPQTTERWHKLAARLAKVVQNSHDGGQPGRPDSALANQKGDRASVLYTLARKLGEDACLVRVLPLGRGPASEPPDPAEYGLEVVRLRLGSRELWYDPALEGGLLDHLRAGLRGRQGLLVGCAQPPADPRVTLPLLGQDADKRRISVELEWFEDGSVTGHVHDVLSGSFATLVRSYLRDATDASRAELLQQVTGTSFGSLTVTYEGADGADDAPLTLRYAVSGAADATRKSALDLALYPDQLGQTYAGLPQRRTRLLFSHAIDTIARWTIHSAGKPCAAAPADVKVDDAVVQFVRTARLAGATVALEKVIRAAPIVVEPEDYRGIAAHLRALDAADSVRIER